MGKAKKPCWSCGRPLADIKGAKCYGCGHVVCVTCAQKYGHGIERYSKQLKTVPNRKPAKRELKS